MDEQNKRIGKRIRALRISHGMTQSSLAGDFITRNMLSLIENGCAAPSLGTLTEIARRLHVSVGYFFADSEEETSLFTKMGIINELQQMYARKDYAACLSACDAISSPDNEIMLLSLRCSLALAKDALENCALASASAALERAAVLAESCTYSDITTLPTIRYLKQLIHAAGQEEIPKSLAEASSIAGSSIPAEFAVYIRALYAIDGGDTATAAALKDSGLILSPVYLTFLEAGLLIARGNTQEAFPLLKKVLSADTLGFFTKYHVLTALESCARVAGDFKAAYQYSAQKVRLLESFTK